MANGIKEFPEMKSEEIFAEPLLYTSYVLACEGHESNYVPVKTMEGLKDILE
jgi:dynein heavy chain